VSGNVQIEIKEGMNQISRKGAKSAYVQGERIASYSAQRVEAFADKPLKCFQAVADMNCQKNHQRRHPDQAILGEQVQIIVVRISSVHEFQRTPEVPLVIEISAAAGSERRAQFELLDRRLPHDHTVPSSFFPKSDPARPQRKLV